MISDGSSRPRIRQRPESRRQREASDSSSRDQPEPFDRASIQGDGPPRPAVPSRSFMALQAVLDNQDAERSKQPDEPAGSSVKNEQEKKEGDEVATEGGESTKENGQDSGEQNEKQQENESEIDKKGETGEEADDDNKKGTKAEPEQNNGGTGKPRRHQSRIRRLFA